ncbi:MAG: UDP-glucose 4-epimerase GalE [Leptolyngbyaceae bacterium]|nr:UDP-glucose 4-epimerase GalE [Leptolyngbyaceae bacterium]
MKILVTGGAGYIGVHTTLLLMDAGIDVVVLDNLSNSSVDSIRRVAHLAGRSPTFVHGDVRDRATLEALFAEHSLTAVMHFAGLKAVAESIVQPLRYYDNNVCGTQVLLQTMEAAGIFSFLFSSSATVYGEPGKIPITENCPLGRPLNPYGRSKVIVEDILRDLSESDPRWHIAILRYFNPVGAHSSGLIGEAPSGVPNNLVPYIAQVAAGRLPELIVYGSDYPTIDGTGVRDYIHVVDLAEGHLRALEALDRLSGVHVWNLGTGRGYSVLQIVRAFEAACGKPVPYRTAPRRPGDVAICYADPNKANRELGWSAVRELDQMMRDTWLWQKNSPHPIV